MFYFTSSEEVETPICDLGLRFESVDDPITSVGRRLAAREPLLHWLLLCCYSCGVKATRYRGGLPVPR
jgi:hypothetical protein